MAKARRERSRGSRPDRQNHEGGGHEPFDDPEEHLEIERRRFRDGLPPTPELYRRAREQWNRLPGSLVRSPMDPVIGDSDVDEQQTPEQGRTDRNRGEQ